MNRRRFPILLAREMLLILAVAALGHAGLRAAPLSATTAVQTRPEASAPLVTFLKAGSEPVPAAEASPDIPAGWMAVSVAGPFTVYVPNQDLTKALEVKPGSSLYLKPSSDAGVLTTSAKGDSLTITGLHGKWTEVRLEKAVLGYIHLGPLPPSPEAQPMPVDVPPPSDLATAGGPGKAAPVSAPEDGALPRYFEGRFTSTHRLFSAPKPYSWQLDDASGARLAYLDVRKLLLTEQIESYAGHDVAVLGSASRVPGTKDMVIVLESLRWK